ncbi:AraC family transcriptional regulator [Sporosarcina aquimarina]|uniref:helix-turn-helix transcriptional regulator n=1 Tax=Sporosarcina aquimarina TaxID=114975 RepID=UPI00204101CC|nr:AraC family transcriptional regulator [Sporosarcina aquimarina]MCM3758008.1 AraC family transcriptional regulator [Sporosarcina aquimarina]
MNEYIQQMIDWIENKLQGEFSLDELANHMGYSPYYCSFKFHQATGISMRRYILLRRLYLSTGDLVMNRKIIDVAVDYNYSSQEAYSRAFNSVFGVSPRDFQRHQMPVQSIGKLRIHPAEGVDSMNTCREEEVAHLQSEKSELFDWDVLNILNGEVMYEEFNNKQLMGNSDYAPFNEAMCVHETTIPIFDSTFIETRALGHHVSIESYTSKVLQPLKRLNQKNYNYIVLWFGEDMFCQMNLLTILAYLEQSEYEGMVYLNSFKEDEFKVTQTELVLGNYYSVYEDVLVNHKKPKRKVLPIMFQAIGLYLEMQTETNPVTKYITRNKQLSQSELLKRLFEVFPMIGYGDTQYIELINRVR